MQCQREVKLLMVLLVLFGGVALSLALANTRTESSSSDGYSSEDEFADNPGRTNTRNTFVPTSNFQARPVRPHPVSSLFNERPLTNSFGAFLDSQSGPLSPSSTGLFNDRVVGLINDKIRDVSSLSSSLLTTISSGILGSNSNTGGLSDRFPSVGSVRYPPPLPSRVPGGTSLPSRPLNSRPIGPSSSSSNQAFNPNTAGQVFNPNSGTSGNRIPSTGSTNIADRNPSISAGNNKNNNPFQIVIVGQPGSNSPLVPVNPSPNKEPTIPVAAGGVAPPSNYVPDDQPFILDDFSSVDPASSLHPSNQIGGSNASPTPQGGSGSSFQPQPPSSSGFGNPGSHFPSANNVPENFGQGSNNFDSSNSLQEIFSVVNGIQEFTLDLISTFRALGSRGNILFSPISIASLLSLLTLGTGGLSSHEIEVALHLPNAQSSSQHHLLYEAILRRLNHESRGVNITTSSRLFVEKNTPIYGTFTSKAAEHYNCTVSLESFQERPMRTLRRVNRWVEESTHGKIKDFISSPFNPDTIFVAANTIYFSGAWETPFPEYFTGVRDFDTGREVMQVPMMTNVFDTLHYYSPKMDLDITSVPYVGGEFAMIILLPRESPKQKSIKVLERQLDTFIIEELVRNMTKKSVSLSLPKMRLSMKSSLVRSLSQLNIETIFSPITSDFSGLTNRKPLWISQFLHEAVMEVTEKGTVAAAASGVMLDRMGGYQRVNVNKPVIIFIRDNITRLPLFWTRLVKPDSIS